MHSTYFHLISIVSAKHNIHLGFKASYIVSTNRSYGNGSSSFYFPYLRMNLAKKTFSLTHTHTQKAAKQYFQKQSKYYGNKLLNDPFIWSLCYCASSPPCLHSHFIGRIEKDMIIFLIHKLSDFFSTKNGRCSVISAY